MLSDGAGGLELDNGMSVVRSSDSIDGRIEVVVSTGVHIVMRFAEDFWMSNLPSRLAVWSCTVLLVILILLAERLSRVALAQRRLTTQV